MSRAGKRSWFVPSPLRAAAAGSELLAREQALVRRMRSGDERALTEFCAVYLPRLYRYARHRLASPEDADDVVQIVLSNAARRIETFRGDATLYSWLTGICRHELSKHAEAEARRGRTIGFGHDDVFDEMVANLEASTREQPEAMAQHRQLVGLVRECLDRLPERQAEALELKYAYGFSSKEIAARLQISDEATQSLLARARRAFRRLCEEHFGGDVETSNGEELRPGWD